MLNAFKNVESVAKLLGDCGFYWRGWHVFFDCALNDLRH